MSTPDLALPPPAADPFAGLADLPVRVTAVVGRVRLPIGDLVKAEAGTVFELDRKSGDPVDILVNDRLIGRGEIVMVGDRLAVTLTDIVEATP